MAPSVSKPSMAGFIAFLWLLLLLPIVNGKIDPCVFRSESWAETPCLVTKDCNDNCMAEGAVSGHCHFLSCLCQFNCVNLCAKLSGTWKGPCVSTALCSEQCRKKENTLRGGCSGSRCWCQYHCT